MAGPGIPVQGAEIRNYCRPEGVEVEVPDQFEEIRLILHHDGFVAILEEVARAPMAAIEASGVAGQESSHTPRERAAPATNEEMGVVREQCPGVDVEAAVLCQGGEPRDEVRTVRIVAEDELTIKSSHHHMVEDPGGIKSRLARHGDGRVA
jgi:hypothetical protein